MSVVRNNWHLFNPWRLTTTQGFCITKSVLPLWYSWTVNESTSNGARYQIDTRLFWNPAKDHQTGLLYCLGLALCIHLEWRRPSDTFKYHYISEGRTPNSDSPVRLSLPCPWTETVRWNWTTRANAPLLGVWSFPSFHLVLDEST